MCFVFCDENIVSFFYTDHFTLFRFLHFCVFAFANVWTISRVGDDVGD